ncbi:MAG: hypothetical protein MK135_15180 [Polyangiaceae bacterium]|nr:hypothetical protein [Polyangiaceae bacterium]
MNRFCVFLTVLVSACVYGCSSETGRSSGAGAEHSSRPTAESEASEGQLLSLVKRGNDVVVVGSFSERAPRMMDLHLKWDGSLVVSDAIAGASSTLAEKTVRLIPEDGGARLLVFSSENVNEIQSGDLAVLKLQGSASTIEIVPTPPMLAPAEAEVGLLLSDPLKL